MPQAVIDQRNAAFWNEACGTTLASSLGILGTDSQSIADFDRAYFGMYPYLLGIVDLKQIIGQSVLEIGLGYGSLSQQLAAVGKFTGIDIAEGSVNLVNHRLKIAGLNGEAKLGTALDLPFENDSFDNVVTIGCLHHTGNLRKAISEVHRILKPKGRATIMVYNAANYKRWLTAPIETMRYVLSGSSEPLTLTAGHAAFDVNSLGEQAPETALVTKSALIELLSGFSSCSIQRKNIASHRIIKFIPREVLMPIFGSWLGLDLYATVIK